MKAEQIAKAARKIEAKRMNRAREVRTRAKDKPVAHIVIAPHVPGKRSMILQYGLEDVNACEKVLRFSEGGGFGKEDIKRLENVCKQVVLAWISERWPR